MHREQVGEDQEGESHPMTEARKRGSSVCHSQRESESVDGDSERRIGKWGLQAKLRVQSSEPTTKAMVQVQKKHCHRRTELLYFFMLWMQRGCRDDSCHFLLLSLPCRLQTNA